MNSVLLAALMTTLGPATAPQAGVLYRFHMENRSQPVPVWSIEVAADGSASYWEGEGTSSDATVRRFVVQSSTVERVASGASTVRSGRCETKLKRIAQTGTKTMSVAGPDGAAQCVFNYSDDDRLNTAATSFLALAETQQSGARLAMKLRFDRLGLDAEMDSLLAELQDGRAIEPRSIQPVLERISKDERVMERVRRKAGHLLESSAPLP